MTVSDPDGMTAAELRERRIKQMIAEAEKAPPLSKEEIEAQRASIVVEDTQGNIDRY